MTIATPETSKVHRYLEECRRRLLDLTPRNRLISFHPLRSGTLHLVEPDPGRILDRLVTQEKAWTFYPQYPVQLPLENGSTITPPPPPTPYEDEIRADADPQRLGTILYRMQLRARTSLEEMGVNTLFVAFGFVEWKETQAATQTMRSPLLLVPVRLARATALDPYRLELLGSDEIVLNPALVERFRRDFNVSLALPDGDATPDLGKSLDTIRQAIGNQPEWCMNEETYLAHFAFHKLAIYRDLQANSGSLAMHATMRALAGDVEALPPPPRDLPNEDELDDKLHPKDTFYILDADGSQLKALAAVDRGADLIIEGPPGTGKSQTIANLIAHAVAQNKRVLFVAEKMAALEVVYRRLADCGLDSVCLQVHSHRTHKRAVLDQLENGLNMERAHQLIAHQRMIPDELSHLRDELNSYARNLHDTCNTLEISAFHAHAEVAIRAEVPALVFSVPSADNLTQEQLSHLIDQVRRLVTVGEILRNGRDHPWWGARMTGSSLTLQDEIRSTFGRFRDAVEAARSAAALAANAWGLAYSESPDGLRWLSAVLKALVENPKPPAGWFDGRPLEPLAEATQGIARQAEALNRTRQALLGAYRPDFLHADLDHLHSHLTTVDARALQPMRTMTDDPAEWAWCRARQLDATLERAVRSSETLIDLVPQMASAIGLARPLTIQEIPAVLRLAGLLLKDPSPLPSWLDRVHLLTCLELAREAQDCTRIIRDEGNAVVEEYDESIYQVAISLAARFATIYATRLRVLRPGYWRDLGLLNALHKTHRHHSYFEACSAALRASRVAAKLRWLDDRKDEIRRLLGSHRLYLGGNTDWGALTDALATTLDILNQFGQHDPPEELLDKLSGRSQLPVGLADLCRRIDASMVSFDTAMAELSTLASLEELLPSRATPEAVCESLAAWHSALSEYWNAVTTARSFLREDASHPVSRLISDVANGAELLKATTRWSHESEALGAELGRFYSGLDTNWSAALSALAWTTGLAQLFCEQPFTSEFIRRVSDGAGLPVTETPVHQALDAAIAEIDEGVRYVATVFESDGFRPGEVDPTEAPLRDLAGWLDLRLGGISRLHEWQDYRRIRAECEAAGLRDFIAQLEIHGPPMDCWIDAFLKRVYQVWLDRQYERMPVLAGFSGARHQSTVQWFRQSDREMLLLNRTRVLRTVLEKRLQKPDAAWPREAAVLRHEIQKRRQHKPVRRLFKEIPNLLLDIKRCLLMSPLSVSHYLAPAVNQFDLVVFDEASQLVPEDAAGSIYRGKQVVIAGDTKQLPPTRFFERQLADGSDDDDPETVQVLESILDQCRPLGMKTEMLRWHYRSHDEELIAFSNRHFYGNKLITFPSPRCGDSDRAISFVHVPDGVYDRGGTRTNRTEARRVVELVVDHFQHRGGQSLGVIAFSSAQMEAIHDELEPVRRRYRNLEPFFADDHLFPDGRREPFFVKNLETVQGDERDFVIFSLGYGKDRHGHMAPLFGPLNQNGGERRLNVAISRARVGIKFVASVLPDEIQLADMGSTGARLLRSYMEYAIRGPTALQSTPMPEDLPEPESFFEEAVSRELQHKGLSIRHQVGCARYRIDLAVEDDRNPGRFLLGIECDGATYHSARTARDRDRLRQEVLEQLGWHIHRIWSTDWLRDPEREIERVMQAVIREREASPPPSHHHTDVRRSSLAQKAATGSATSPHPVTSTADVGANQAPAPLRPAPRSNALITSGEEAAVGVDVAENTQHAPSGSSTPTGSLASRRVVPYKRVNLHTRSPQELAAFYSDMIALETIPRLVENCAYVESPVHVTRVTGVIAQLWGYQQVDDSVVRQIERGIDEAVAKHKVVRRGDFIWRNGMKDGEVPVRVPRHGEPPRHISEIALEELGRALRFIMEEHGVLPTPTLFAETAALLCLDRGDGNQASVAKRLEESLATVGDLPTSAALE